MMTQWLQHLRLLSHLMSILLNIFIFSNLLSHFLLVLSDAVSALVVSTTWTRDHHKHNTFNLLVFGKLDFSLHHDLILKNDDIAGEIHLLLQDSVCLFPISRETTSLYFQRNKILHWLVPFIVGAESCSTLCNPIDCRPPGSSVHGISQARILEWVAISFSRGSSWSRDWTHVACVSCSSFVGRLILYHKCHLGSLYRDS